MQSSSIPAKIPVPFGAGATSGYIRTVPVPSQISTDPGAASFTDGFPPLTFLPVSAGGIPPDGRDINGILNEITAWLQWMNAGGPVGYDSAFSAAIGGYPKGALLSAAAGGWWVSTVENNTTDPDTGGAGWQNILFGTQPTYWCGTSTGTANAQTVTPPAGMLSMTAGTGISFKAGFTNTGAMTLTVGTFGTFNVEKDSPTGPIALTGGELVAGNIVSGRFDGTYIQLTATEMGTAALANASSNTGTVAAVSGAVTAGNLAKFSDVNGTVTEGPALSSAQTTVAAVSGAGTIGVGNLAVFNDVDGTVTDSGVSIANASPDSALYRMGLLM